MKLNTWIFNMQKLLRFISLNSRITILSRFCIFRFMGFYDLQIPQFPEFPKSKTFHVIMLWVSGTILLFNTLLSLLIGFSDVSKLFHVLSSAFSSYVFLYCILILKTSWNTKREYHNMSKISLLIISFTRLIVLMLTGVETQNNPCVV